VIDRKFRSVNACRNKKLPGARIPENR